MIARTTELTLNDRLFFVERRGGYPWAEGYHNRNDHLPLPARLANDGRPTVLPLRVYETDIPADLRLSALTKSPRPLLLE